MKDNPQALARGLSTKGTQTMLYLTCTMISRVDLAHNGVSCAKDLVSVDCGTIVVFHGHHHAVLQKENGWKNDLQFYNLFNNILVISRPWDSDYESLCAMCKKMSASSRNQAWDHKSSRPALITLEVPKQNLQQMTF